jgi:general secretion pathway protein G
MPYPIPHHSNVVASVRQRLPAQAGTHAEHETPLPRAPRRLVTKPGFTLIELLVVLAIVALLLTLAVPRFFPSIDGARETILADNLRNTREVIDHYYADTGRYPDSLEQLVEKNYLRNVPVDPITESADTWIIVPPEESSKGAVYSIRSGAPGTGRNGKPYAEW